MATTATRAASGSLRNTPAALVAAGLALACWQHSCRGQPANAFEAAEPEPAAEQEPVEPGVVLPSDRDRERKLDRARRLVADERWSDAAAALDELLAVDRDAFVSAGVGATKTSLRSQAAALLAGLPRPGREAYELLFRSRAETRLAAAIAANDAAGIVAVARRWLHTPAGRDAALIAALLALESGRPTDATAWLERRAALPAAESLEPTLSVIRAVARAAAGDSAAADGLLAAAAGRGRSGVRLAGRELAIPPGGDKAVDWLANQVAPPATATPAGREWTQFRGGPARVGLVDASRPLLVPRYRVPLVRHPEEARQLEKLRQAAADDGRPLLPAGTPLAVGERIVVQTPLGILAIDFETGRRVWLESAVKAAEPDDGAGGDALRRVFDDATSGNLASDGSLVFAVESEPEALSQRRDVLNGFGRGQLVMGGGWERGNTLSAYELHGGKLRWRLPADRDQGDDRASRWHLGPPLVTADELFVLVEEEGEVRVEARAAADGGLRWSQPLAGYEDGDAITSGMAADRRLAGLTPALDDGVLVCPLGAGCTVGIDLATRSLLWAHAYQRIDDRLEARFNQPAAGGEPARSGEPAPLIAAGHVVLAPSDAKTLFCLGLRDGQLIWEQPREDRSTIAGIVAGRVIVVTDGRVEALDLASGGRQWRRDLAEGVRPSGRGILTPRSLLLPCDTPAVLEIAVADGRVVGSSPARGGHVPGTLVAHRGEIICRSLDALDVFHQEAALEARIETAFRADPASPWAAYWQGQAAIETGALEAGFDALSRAAASAGFRIPPGDVAAAFAAAMRHDFSASARRWAAFPGAPDARTSPLVDRLLVDGFLSAGDAAAAWDSLHRLLHHPVDLDSDPPPLIDDPADPQLAIDRDRWLGSRLAMLAQIADDSLRQQMVAGCERLVASGRETADPSRRLRVLAAACFRLGRHPAGDSARRELAATAAGLDRRSMVRSELVALETLGNDTAIAPPTKAGDGDLELESAWPLGRVDHRELQVRDDEAGIGGRQVLPLPFSIGAGAGTRAASAGFDFARQELLICDDLGRLVSGPLPVEGVVEGFGLPFLNLSGTIEVACLGRAVFIRSPAGIVAYDLEAPVGAGRGIWQQRTLGTSADAAAARWGGGVGGRVARDGAVPLGLRIGEPEERPRGGGRGMTALPCGLVVPGPRSITVLDLASGRPLWERHGLPAGLEWYADGEFLCGGTVDGRSSLVFAAADGRRLHSFDLPHRRQRVASRGRRLVTVDFLDEPTVAGAARRVRLDLVDPADRETRPLGEFSGEARATETGDGRLAVMEPDGGLTVFDLADGAVVFRQLLPASPRRFERLQVHAWEDRYLVFAGGTAEDDATGADISPLEQLLLASGSTAPVSGGIWALDRHTGRPLWPVPAIVERHCLHTAQPTGLPVLTFCRILQPRGRGPATLSLLCLDKRTGHAVFDDDRIRLQPPNGFGCNVAGDPERHTVRISGFAGAGASLVLAFTGQPISPQPPHQGRNLRTVVDVARGLPAVPRPPARPGELQQPPRPEDEPAAPVPLLDPDALR